MSRRKHQEEHQDNERWAIPYGDLVTLLLAFFVVMYSISSVNEGKYRVLSDSLNAAFRGAPTTTEPIQIGQPAATTIAAPVVQLPGQVKAMAMRQLAKDAENALAPLILQGLVDMNEEGGIFQISIRSDILFSSGSAALSSQAQPVIRMLGDVLRGFSVNIRVEGHTDDVPITSVLYPSNWELSAARAASVVHLLTDSGVAPERLSVVAFGQYRAVLPNATPDGRNANRRVVLSIEGSEPAEATEGRALAAEVAAPAVPATTAAATAATAASPVAAP